jgi:integrase
MAAGIVERHSRACPSRSGGACRRPCTPSFEAWVWSRRDGKKIRQTFPTQAAAKGWRSDSVTGLRKGTMRAPTSTTLRAAAEAWLEAAEAGLVRKRGGQLYKPSVIRSYRTSLNLGVLPELGGRRLSEIERRDVQALADRMHADGVNPSTLRNTLAPLRVIFRRALRDGEVSVNPTSGLELPAVTGRRDRIADPQEAAKLIAAVPEKDRALWATAVYAGLRRGELMALRFDDVDLATNVIRVERSWDVQEGPQDPKSRAGTRTVPIVATLREQLIQHRLRGGRSEGLIFGRSSTVPFDPKRITERADAAWTKAKLSRITLHECRHTFASLMIAAGVNAKALSTYMGHFSITITMDRYGHLMPGNEDEAAGLLEAYLLSSKERISSASTQKAPITERSSSSAV